MASYKFPSLTRASAYVRDNNGWDSWCYEMEANADTTATVRLTPGYTPPSVDSDVILCIGQDDHDDVSQFWCRMGDRARSVSREAFISFREGTNAALRHQFAVNRNPSRYPGEKIRTMSEARDHFAAEFELSLPSQPLNAM